MDRREVLLKRILPLLVLVAGGGIAYWLIATEPKPEKESPASPGQMVETTVATRTREQITIRAQGTVVPARSVNVQARVAGEIIAVNPDLKPGGVLREGAPLVTIDPADFKLLVARRETELSEARAQLALEQGRQDVAQEEWALFRKEFATDAQAPGLALREPQRAAAEAQVARAQAALDQARLELARTRVTAPFHALVLEESAAEGQYVQPPQSIAQLVGADRFWVRAVVPPDQIGYIDIPSAPGEKGSPVEVLLELGPDLRRFDGYVSRLEGRLDEQSRLARLIVTVPNPLGAGGAGAGADFPLLLNAYVTVVIAAQETLDAFVVPRAALHAGNQAYVFDDGRLRIRTLDIAWERENAMLVRAGLEEGDLLITSNIASPVEGMRLRLAPAKASP